MSDEMIKIIIIFVFTAFIIYIINKLMRQSPMMIEGLENMPSKDAITANADGSNVQTIKENGEAGNAANYATKLKNIVTKMNDTFLIDKYRKDYENVVINMDDLVNGIMLKTVLNIQASPQDQGAVVKQLAVLNMLNESKTSLNNVMKYIDKSGGSSTGKWL